MEGIRKEPQVKIKMAIRLNAVETVLVDRLVESGLWGYSRQTVVRRLLDEKLVSLFGRQNESDRSRIKPR